MDPQLSYASQAEPTVPAAAPKNFFSRLSGVYFAPGETFAEIGRAPRVVVPLLVLVLLTILGVYVFFDRMPMDKMMEQRIEQAIASNQMTPEQAEQQREGMRKFAPVMKYGSPIFAGIFIVLLTLFIAGVAKLVSMMMGIENTFMPLWAVAIYATLAVSILSTILFVILAYIKSPDEIDMENPVGSNLAAVLAMAGVALPRFLKTLLTYVDVFFIWKMALLAIGFAAVSRKLKTGTALIYTGVIALLFVLIAAAWSAVGGGMSG
jgi:hypothetical protein